MQALYLEIKNLIISTLNLEELTPEDIDTDAALFGDGLGLDSIDALELGLARRFRGAVDHLRIALDMRMAAGSDTPRCYLVIYDSVPGGTGYLKELMRAPEPLLEVFDIALQALNSCACNQNADTDGCYRCVYRYHNSHDRRPERPLQVL